MVREIKLLRERSVGGGNPVSAAHGTTGNPAPPPGSPSHDNNFTEDFLNAGDEEKLIQELEEHVLSSIRLHEAYLSSVPMTATTKTREEDDDDSAFVDTSGDTDADRSLVDHMAIPTPTLHPNVPLFEQEPTAIVSLFDNDEDDDDDDDEPNPENADYRNLGATDRDELETDITTPTTNITSKKATTEDSIDDDDDDCNDRPNPLLHLDDDDNHMDNEIVPSSSIMSEQNRPTYHLSCPLTNAISAACAGTNTQSSKEATQKQVSSNVTTDSEASQVYHITFYSRKIGIQFQKVPPTPIKAKGLLTEAMTDDLSTSTTGTTNGTAGGTSNTTAAELRRIAAISMSSKGNNHSKSRIPDICDVATPVDAVLVCGFDGFDDESNRTTNNCPRPKLGARLVAFDGVSIEIGRWTFTAVRKAIQACGRPLTLSFRNDYLTKEQRTILTKAVLDVDMASSSYRPSTESLRGPVVMKQNSYREPDLKGPVPTVMTDDMSESAGGDSDYLNSFPQSFSGNRSVNSLAQYRSFYETRSYSSSSVGDCNNKHKKIRSFSEAGGSATTTTTSSSVLSAIGPLVSNLLYRPRRPSEPFTPEYLRRAPEFVEETPQHQDFQSELL